MKFSNFERYVQAVQQRVNSLQQEADHLSLSNLQEQSLAELSIAVEELHVACEEIQQQNQELSSTRQALELERQRYQELFELAPDAYVVTDNRGVIEEANSAATQLLNVSQKYLIGKPLAVYVAADDQQAFQTQITQMQSSVQHLKDWEIQLQPREAPPLSVAISVATRVDAQGKIQGWRWLIRDLRERKQAELLKRELEIQKHFNKFKTSLLSSISHEFRTPLNILLMSIGMIERHLPSEQDEQKQRICQRMRIAVRFLTLLLEQIEFFHYSYMSDPALSPALIELEQFCHQVALETRQFAASEHEVIINYNSQRRSLCFDVKLLQQILRNLLSNALKYSPAESPVELTVKDGEGVIIFELQDNGIGILEGDHARIYEPFYRGSNVDSVAGVGIGLAVVKKAIDFCQGEITFTSQVNRGTTFTVTLPLA